MDRQLRRQTALGGINPDMDHNPIHEEIQNLPLANLPLANLPLANLPLPINPQEEQDINLPHQILNHDLNGPGAIWGPILNPAHGLLGAIPAPGLLGGIQAPQGPRDRFFRVIPVRGSDTEFQIDRSNEIRDDREIRFGYIPTRFGTNRFFSMDNWGFLTNILWVASIKYNRGITEGSNPTYPEILTPIVMEGQSLRDGLNMKLVEIREEIPNLLEILIDLTTGNRIQYRYE